MTVVNGSDASGKPMNAPLELRMISGEARIYDIRTRTVKTKTGIEDRTAVSFEDAKGKAKMFVKNTSVRADLAELAKMKMPIHVNVEWGQGSAKGSAKFTVLP